MPEPTPKTTKPTKCEKWPHSFDHEAAARGEPTCEEDRLYYQLESARVETTSAQRAQLRQMIHAGGILAALAGA